MEERIEINQSNIVQDILDQSVLFHEVLVKITNLKLELKLVKAAMEREAARLDTEIRSSTKVKKTETAIKNEIIINESYIKLNERVMEVERQLDEANHLKQALEMKAEMLKLLGKDFIGQVEEKKGKIMTRTAQKKEFKKF